MDTQIYKNALLQWHASGSQWLERVLFVDPIGKEAVFVGLDQKLKISKGWPFWRSFEEIDEKAKNGDFHVLSPELDTFLRPPVDRELMEKKDKARKEKKDKAESEKDKGGVEHWDKVSAAVQAVHDDPKQSIFRGRKKRKGIITMLAQACGLHRSRVYPLFRKFWGGGQTPQCLLPDPCGNPGATRQFKGGAKRGRKSAQEKKNETSIGIVMTAEVEAQLLKGIKKYYQQDGANTLDDAYALTMAEFFNAGFETQDGIDVPVLKSKEELPTFRQFYRVYEKHRDAKTEAIGREGENSFQLNGRAITGNTELSIMGPGVVGQIDWTTADIYLKSDDDPALNLGRPNIYSMIDAWGRFFYSVIVTFEHGGYWAGAMALENALVDKVDYCAQHGVKIDSHIWPVNFWPEELRVDGGEFSKYKPRHLVESLGMKISVLPPRRPDLKGIVERSFGRINGQLIRWLPGALPKLRNKDEKSSPLDAKLTVGQFRRLLIEAILRYHRQELRRYRPSADMIKAGIRYTPIELLNFGVKYRSGRMLKFPLDQARLHLLPGGQATVTPGGIRFQKLMYTSDRAVEEGWYEKARKGGDYKILVAFDPRIVDRIFLRGLKTKELEPLVLSDQGFAGWTWTAVEQHFEKKRAESQEHSHDELQDKVRVQAAVIQISQNAKALQEDISKNTGPLNKAAELRTAPKNRTEFCEQERRASARSKAQTEAPPPPESEVKNIVPFPQQPSSQGSPPANGLGAALRNKLNKLRGSKTANA
jgi:putative transposase